MQPPRVLFRYTTSVKMVILESDDSWHLYRNDCFECDNCKTNNNCLTCTDCDYCSNECSTCEEGISLNSLSYKLVDIPFKSKCFWRKPDFQCIHRNDRSVRRIIVSHCTSEKRTTNMKTLYRIVFVSVSRKLTLSLH